MVAVPSRFCVGGGSLPRLEQSCGTQPVDEVAQQEECCQHPHGDADFLGTAMAAETVHEDIYDYTNHDAFGDAVAQRHQQHGEECGDGFAVVVPFDLGDAGAHHHAHNDQGGTCGGGGNGQEERTQEKGQGKAAGYHQGGEARTAPFANAGGTLDVGGGGGSTHAGAYGGGNGIGHQYAADFVNLAVLVHHARFHRNAYHGADGVEHVYKQEGEYHDEHVPGEDVVELELEEDGLNRGGHRGDTIELGDSHGDADKGGGQYAPQDAALDVQHHQQAGDEDADEGQQSAAVGEVEEGDKGALATDDDAGALQSDEGDVETNTDTDGGLHAGGYGVDYQFAHFENRQQDEDDTFDQDGRQGKLPAVAHAEADGVHKEGVQSHAGGQAERFLGPHGHDQRAHDGGQRGGREDGVGGHPFVSQGTEDAGIDGQDVGHG